MFLPLIRTWIFFLVIFVFLKYIDVLLLGLSMGFAFMGILSARLVKMLTPYIFSIFYKKITIFQRICLNIHQIFFLQTG